MSKLLRIDRKLRTLGRRLTTDANGAPCCCQTSDSCPCDPALPLAPFPYVACVGGRYANSAGGSTLTLNSAPARIAVVRAQWQVTQTYQTRNTIGTYVSIIDRVQRHQGSAQWCVVRTNLSWNSARWLFNNATSGFEYQQVGNLVEPINIAENYQGGEALGYFTVTGANSRGPFKFIAPPPEINAAFFTANRTGIAVTVLPFSDITLETQAYGDPTACVVTTNYRRSIFGGTLTQSRRFDFASSSTQAAYTENVSSDNTARSGDYTRETYSIAAIYTTQYLTCTTGGDPTGSLIGEPGCSNCFDPSKLEPM